MMRRLIVFVLISSAIVSCGKKTLNEPSLGSRDINRVVSFMTDVMVHDVTNPPLAARFFSYACLSGYEVVSQNDKNFKPMRGVLREYPEIEKPEVAGNYSPEIAAVLAMIATAKKMQPSGMLFEDYEKKFIDSCARVGFPKEEIENAKVYAAIVSKQILNYAKSDGYNKISNYPRYTPVGSEGNWYPTPPGFFAPVEPYFHKVRPLTLDSCSQFKPKECTPFSKDKNSAFYKMLLQNHEFGKDDLDDEQRQIAAFWDCNPFALKDNGHMMIGMKKISPGAHWLGITGIACDKAGVPFAKAMEINTVVSIGLLDGFISCWDEKYRSNRIRPETAIRKLIDPSWQPMLQTPPFPEYLSGHSTVSTTIAEILTYYFGDNFEYTDDVEVRFGLPARSFSSFKQAAEEAAISRLYGGIHFIDAIENGKVQGQAVGEWIVNKMKNNKPDNDLAINSSNSDINL